MQGSSFLSLVHPRYKQNKTSKTAAASGRVWLTRSPRPRGGTLLPSAPFLAVPPTPPHPDSA